MKKVFLIATMAVLSVFTFYACGGGTSKGSATEQKQAMKTVYTCEMHPEVMLDQPGKCPKCGMELVKKEVAVADTTHMHHGSDSTMNN